ncbi:MAG: hypothetical protein ACT4O0_01540 [Pseudonocardia sp.]
MTGSGAGVPARGYSWPPFEPGNEVAVTHGAWSPRRVDPLATELVDTLLADPDVSFLRAPAYRTALWAWGRAEAQVQLLTEYIADNGGIAEALAEHGSEESDETHDGGRSRRVSRSRRVGSALAALDRAEARAASLRARLGLDPLSRARLGRDVAAAQVDGAEFLTRLREAAEAQQEGTG